MKHGLTNKELKFLICDYWCVKYMLRKLNQRQKLHYSAKDETSEAISGFSRILAASSTKLEANTPDSTVELVKTGWNPIQRSAQISSRFLCNSILLDQNFLTESCEFVHLDRRFENNQQLRTFSDWLGRIQLEHCTLTLAQGALNLLECWPRLTHLCVGQLGIIEHVGNGSSPNAGLFRRFKSRASTERGP